MKGYARDKAQDEVVIGKLEPWESLVADAVGNVIEFWSFKRSHGMVWALLYLRGRPLDATTIQGDLGLSKGGVSMAVRELEQWGVVRRVRTPGEGIWRYLAETDFLGMIGKVVAEREGALVDSVARDLSRAEAQAQRSEKPADPDALMRLGRMRALADLVSNALRAFLHTASFNVQPLRNTLVESDTAPPAKAPAKAPTKATKATKEKVDAKPRRPRPVRTRDPE